MQKVRLRFPLSALHRHLLQYLRLAVTQITLNAWMVFLSAEVLYGAMFDGARRLTMEEFFHCYRPTEIIKSKGMHSFVPRSPILRLVCDTPDSNRNWKSCYFFFMEGDEWMCHPGDQECMLVDKTWGIMPLSGMHPSVFRFLIVLALLVTLTVSHYSLGLSSSHT